MHNVLDTVILKNHCKPCKCVNPWGGVCFFLKSGGAKMLLSSRLLHQVIFCPFLGPTGMRKTLAKLLILKTLRQRVEKSLVSWEVLLPTWEWCQETVFPLSRFSLFSQTNCSGLVWFLLTTQSNKYWLIDQKNEKNPSAASGFQKSMQLNSIFKFKKAMKHAQTGILENAATLRNFGNILLHARRK